MIDWKEHRHGSGATADLGHGLTLGFSWESIERLPSGVPSYNVFVFGRRLKERAASGPEAKERAVRAAAKWLDDISAKLKSADIKSEDRL